MSRVTIVGAGKLGFPVGCVMKSRGHNVTFYDKHLPTLDRWMTGQLPEEVGLREIYAPVAEQLQYAGNIDLALMGAEYVFVAVQTPHAPEQDGSRRWRGVKKDFDLSYVKAAVSEITASLTGHNKSKTPVVVTIISTMLPGSMVREIVPLFQPAADEGHILCYSPSFIAMGTVVQDFQNPEFWLLGGPNTRKLEEFYNTISYAPMRKMSYTSAEATKVLYNTWITMKITLANLAMEIAERVGANADDITGTLQMADDRLTSPRYMSPGMVDGGSCHPRDNIAMAWLSDQIGMDYNLFETMMNIREKQVEFLADMIQKSRWLDMPVVLSDRAFKSGTSVTAGSPALLLQAILAERGISSSFLDEVKYSQPACIVLTTNKMPKVKDNDIVIDPWGVSTHPNTIRVGR